MEIKEIKANKKQFLPLLLLADEQEDMIDRYLDRGTNFFIDHYDHPIYEAGIQLVDMIYLQKKL